MIPWKREAAKEELEKSNKRTVSRREARMTKSETDVVGVPPEKKPRLFSTSFSFFNPVSALSRLFGGNQENVDEDDNSVVFIDGENEQPVIDLTDSEEDEVVAVATVSREMPVTYSPSRLAKSRKHNKKVLETSFEVQNPQVDDDSEDEVEVLEVKTPVKTKRSSKRSPSAVEKEDDVIVISEVSSEIQEDSQHGASTNGGSDDSKENAPDVQVVFESIGHDVLDREQRKSIEYARDAIVRSAELADDDRESGSSDVIIEENETEDVVLSNATSPLPEDSASRSATPLFRANHAHTDHGRSPRVDRWQRSTFRKSRQSLSKNSTTIKKVALPSKKYSSTHSTSSPVNMAAQRRYMKILDEMGISLNVPTGKFKIRGKSSVESAIEKAQKVLRSRPGSERSSREVSVEPSSEDRYVSDRSVASGSASPAPNTTLHSEGRLGDLVSRLRTMKLNSTTFHSSYNKFSSSLDFSRNKSVSLQEELRVRGAVRACRDTVEEKTRQRLGIAGIKYVPKKKEKDEFPPLSEEALHLCSDVWKRLPEMQVMTEGFGAKLTCKDLRTLSGLQWLNDEVINFYLQLVCERSKNDENLPKTYSFNTFFYANLSSKGFSSVKRWTRKVDIFSFDVLLVPVHLKVHWCMAVIDFGRKIIEYYDSLLGRNQQCLQDLKNYLMEESKDKKKVPFDFNGWNFVLRSDIPEQLNGSDCGVFSCKFGEFASRRREIVFDQSHMPYYRKRMVYEIVNKSLL